MLNSCSAPFPWLHLEFTPKGSIQDHLYGKLPFSDRECRQIFVQTSDALAYIHSQVPPLVHRDVKPANILIKHRSSGRDDVIVKFGDFGLSREGDILETVCGTWTYTAPEVHKADYTAFVDVWSLGVVLV